MTETVNDPNLYSIKFGFNEFCAHDVFRRNVIHISQSATKLAFFGSTNYQNAIYRAIINKDDAFLQQHFRSKPNVRNYFLDFGYTKKRAADDNLLNRYNVEAINMNGMTQVANYIIKDYLTVYGNATIANCPRVLKKLFRLYYKQIDLANQTQPTNAEKRDRTRNIKRTIRYLTYPPSIVPATDVLKDFAANIGYDGGVLQRGHFNIDSNNWHRFVVPLVKISLHLYRQNQRLPMGYKCGYGLDIIPQHGLTRIHITLDKTSMYEINNCNFARSNLQPHELTAQNAKFSRNRWGDFYPIWMHCINMHNLTNVQQERFAFFAKTDGNAISFLFHRPTVQIGTQDQMTAIRRQYNQNYFRQLVGIDAGSMYPIVFCAVEPQNNFRETMGYLSSAKYQSEQMLRQHKENIERVTKKYMCVQKSSIALCNRFFEEPPSSRSAEYHVYRIHRVKIFKMGFEERVVKPDVSMELFNFYRLRQRMAARIANEIAGGVPTLVAIADNPIHQNSPIKGYVRPPINLINHALEIHPLITTVKQSEIYTTQKCSYSFDQLDLSACTTKKRIAKCPNCNPAINQVLPPSQQYRRINMLNGERNRIPFSDRPAQVIGVRDLHRDGDAARCMTYLLKCKVDNVVPNAAFTRP